LAEGVGIKRPRVRRFEQSSGPSHDSSRIPSSWSAWPASFCAVQRRRGICRARGRQDFHL